MRSVVLLLTALLVASCSTPSKYERQTSDQPKPVVVTADSKAPPGAPPLLWKLTKPDHGTLFIFGTMHFGVAYEQLPAVVGETIAACDTFVLESDPTSADPTRLAELMMLPKKTPGLDERLGPERWTKLLELLDGLFEDRVAERVQPWVLEAAVIRQLMSTEVAMETGLVEKAQEHNLPVTYLEDWETQIVLLNRVSSVKTLSEIVDDPAKFRDRTRAMSADYIRGDIKALERHIFGSHFESQDEVFESRNREWLERLETLARGGKAFIAVGAGHLLGADSVLTLLAARGYEVERVQ